MPSEMLDEIIYPFPNVYGGKLQFDHVKETYLRQHYTYIILLYS